MGSHGPPFKYKVAVRWHRFSLQSDTGLTIAPADHSNFVEKTVDVIQRNACIQINL